MMKRSSRYFLLQGIVVSTLALVCLISYAISNSLKIAEEKLNENLEYVSYEVLTDNIMPVAKQEQTNITRPYTNKDVEIGKSYYDYKAEEKNQENSIIYYENTYIQNTGVDYTSKEIFEINSIDDGTIVSITTDDIVGTTVKIKHDNNLISVYQSIQDVTLKEKDKVARGQVFAKSGTNSINSKLGNHLHFELYKDNILINPEEFFIENQGN